VLAVALAEFGVLETGRIAQQAQRRLRFLDEIEKLINNPDTKEAAVHTALATNLWVFVAEFALVVSNTTLANTLKKYTDEKFTDPEHRTDPTCYCSRNSGNATSSWNSNAPATRWIDAT
jgi:hypothetical protein